MRIAIFEFVSGGGWWKVDPSGRPPKSLLQEGKTMLAALASDFNALPDTEVLIFHDARVRRPVEVPGAKRMLVRRPVDLFRGMASLAKEVDYGILIAPEFNSHLLDWAEKWPLLGGKLLSPDANFVRIASSKSATADRLRAAGVPLPRGQLLQWIDAPPSDFPYPAILKPDDGAGSQSIFWCKKPADVRAKERVPSVDWRLEQFVPGLAASVAVLCGPAGPVALPASLQWLSDDRKFAYRGGMTPLAPGLNARAQRLALQAIAALPSTVGYVGIDLVLGDDPAGSRDFAIEVNPRLTTSYVGLRAICRQNLAQAMLAVASGQPVDLSYDDRRVQFTPDGQLVELSSS